MATVQKNLLSQRLAQRFEVRAKACILFLRAFKILDMLPLQ
jgi:hypothetical protein